MNRKMVIWLIPAVILCLVTGLVGVTQAANLRELTMGFTDLESSLFTSSGSLMDELFGSSYILDLPTEPYVALVSVAGTIDTASTDGYDHYFLTDYINSLIDDPNNKAILLYMNSPGGTMNAADDLYLTLMDYKEYTGRPIYCYFDDYACSGGYYVAMAADEICANRNSMCVNIGVYIATYDVSGLFEKLGVETVVFRSSDNKGIGLTGAEWTDEQKEIYQSIVDECYDQFIEVVEEGRGMTRAEIMEKNDGREMTAKQALNAGFVDSIDRYQNYMWDVLDREGIEYLYEPEYTTGILSELGYYMKSETAKSEAETLLDFAASHDGITVMAYDENR